MNPDEAVNMAKKQRLLHWDSRKKKFVQTTVGELAEGKGSTKIRTESGERAGIHIRFFFLFAKHLPIGLSR